MKTLTITLLALCSCCALYSQHPDIEIRLETYKPIVTPGMNAYYNDEWILSPVPSNGSQYTRKYQNIGFSTACIRHFKSFNAGLRLGFVTRKVDETSSFSINNGNLFQAFSYQQKHVMGSIFIQKTETIKFLNIQIGLEIPYIKYGEATSVNSGHTESYDNGQLWSKSEGSSTYVTGSGFGTGIGLNFGIAFKLKKYMSIGAELNEYLLYTKFVKPNQVTSSNSMEYYNPESKKKTTSNYTQYVDFRQTVFSQLAPRVFYAVYF